MHFQWFLNYLAKVVRTTFDIATSPDLVFLKFVMFRNGDEGVLDLNFNTRPKATSLTGATADLRVPNELDWGRECQRREAH
jgi:hypothetical protein